MKEIIEYMELNPGKNFSFRLLCFIFPELWDIEGKLNNAVHKGWLTFNNGCYTPNVKAWVI